MEYKKQGFPKRLLAGRSARIVVTMGMPVLRYRWYFGAYGLRAFERSMLSFAGIKPIHESLYGLTLPMQRSGRAGSKRCASTAGGATDPRDQNRGRLKEPRLALSEQS